MASNIMMNWSSLAPKKDFFESFVAPLLMGQEAKSRQLEQEQAQIQNQFLPQKYQNEILGQELMNQERQATLPYAQQGAEAELMGQLLLNENRQLSNQYMPQEQQMKAQEHAMMNAVKNMQMQKYAAEIQKMQNPDSGFNPLDTSGVARQVAIANWYEQQGDVESAEKIRASLGGGGASIAQRQWSSLPINEREAILATGRSLGIDATEMQDRIIGGETVDDIVRDQATKTGLSYEEMKDRDPVFLATTAAKTAAQKREAFTYESQFLTDKFTQWMEPYVDPATLMTGIPVKQLTDAVKGITDDEEAAKFVAATMIYPELVGARGRALGMDLGIEAMHELQDASMGNIKAIKGAISQKVWSRAQQLANETIGGSSSFANSILINPEKHAREKNTKSKDVAVQDLDNMSIEELEKLLGETQ